MAREFVSSDPDYLEYAGSVVSSEPLTLACWAQAYDLTASQFLFALGATSETEYWALQTRGNVNDKLAASRNGGGETFTAAESTITYPVYEWMHCCGVFAASNDVRVYLNGGNKGTDTNSRNIDVTNRTTIGSLAYSGGHTNSFDGIVAEAAIWNAALTDAEVASLATGVSPFAIRPQSLVAYWPLFGTLSPEVDVVGGYGMTLYSAPTQVDHPPNMPSVLSPQIQYQEPAAGGTLLVLDPRTGKPEAV